MVRQKTNGKYMVAERHRGAQGEGIQVMRMVGHHHERAGKIPTMLLPFNSEMAECPQEWPPCQPCQPPQNTS